MNPAFQIDFSDLLAGVDALEEFIHDREAATLIAARLLQEVEMLGAPQQRPDGDDVLVQHGRYAGMTIEAARALINKPPFTRDARAGVAHFIMAIQQAVQAGAGIEDVRAAFVAMVVASSGWSTVDRKQKRRAGRARKVVPPEPATRELDAHERQSKDNAPKVNPAMRASIIEALQKGETVTSITTRFGLSRSTVHRIKASL